MSAPGSREPRSGEAVSRRPIDLGDELVSAWHRAAEPKEREAIFLRIYTGYYREILNFFVKRGVAGEDARDLAQETLLRVYTGLRSFRGDSSFNTWVFVIAAHVLRNSLRERAARKRGASEVALDELSESTAETAFMEQREPSQPAQALEHERQHLVREAIQGLPPQMRRCVLLRLDQQLRYHDIAVLLGISIDSVKSHLFQARERLRHELRGHFEDIVDL
jgi:RNA polymerase sigma-70 factor (ECF subfamily)